MQLMRYILFFTALLIMGSCNALFAQSTILNQGNATTLTNQLGGIGADKWLRLPPCNNPTTTTRRHGFACITWASGSPAIAVWDTVSSQFVVIVSDAGTDSTIFSTTYDLDTAKANIRGEIADRQIYGEWQGTIYHQDTWANYDTFTIASSLITSIDANGDILLYGGNGGASGATSSRLILDRAKVLNKYGTTVKYIVHKNGTNTYGLRVGSGVTAVWLDIRSSSGGVGTMRFSTKLPNGSQTQNSAGTMVLPYSLGDTLELTLLIDEYQANAIATNITQDTAIKYQLSYFQNTTFTQAQTGTDQYSLYLGGSQDSITVLDWNIWSNATKNDDLMIISDSKAFQWASSITTSYTEQLRPYFEKFDIYGVASTSLHGYYDSSANTNAGAEMRLLTPKQILFSLGSNNLRSATPDTTLFKIRYSRLIDSFVSQGSRVVHIYMYETSGSIQSWVQDWLIDWLVDTYGDSLVMTEVYNYTRTCLNCSSDGVHPNQKSHDNIFRLILQSGKLKYVKTPVLYQDSVAVGNSFTFINRYAWSAESLMMYPSVKLRLDNLTNVYNLNFPNSMGVNDTLVTQVTGDARYLTSSSLTPYMLRSDSATSGANVYVTPTGVRTIGDANYIPLTANITSGKYLPTLTAITNLDAATSDTLRYIRIGNIVQVSGFFALDATATNTTTTVDISLPIATTLVEFNDAGGTATTRSNSNNAPTMGIYANAATNRARLDYNAATTSATTCYITFSYEIK